MRSKSCIARRRIQVVALLQLMHLGVENMISVLLPAYEAGSFFLESLDQRPLVN